MDPERTALNLLENKFDREPPYIAKYTGYFVGLVLGVGAVCAGNYGVRRPIFSGIQNHVLSGGIGAYAINWLRDRGEAYYAERDAVLRHYIQLHPEDFPLPERKKYGELILPWTPVR